jgi:long-chain acyl-CoA synthetase
MFIDFLFSRCEEHADSESIIWNDKRFTYRWLHDQVNYWLDTIGHHGLMPGKIVVLEGDFSPNSIALFLALLDSGVILVPLTPFAASLKEEFIRIAQAEVLFSLDDQDNVSMTTLDQEATHELYSSLKENAHPGLVLFSSGSTGKNKAAVHDFLPLLEKFKTPRRCLRSISFMMYDHIGGINTMLYMLSNGGCLVTLRDRSPDVVLRAVQEYGVELLPTTPTFINLMLITSAYKRYDLSSLKVVTYGTEPMLESTLKLFHKLFPNIDLVQTYGLSEVGILRAKSKGPDTLWVKVGGEGFETRVKDGILHIKARSAMLGYLNAPNPFTPDGWFNTGDRVEVDGEYIKILGRDSELINVGGEKVYPVEVESVIQEIDNVAEAVVYGEKNPLTGQVVCVRIRLIHPEDVSNVRTRIKAHCRKRLQNFKVPVRVIIVDENQFGPRFKRIRRFSAS